MRDEAIDLLRRKARRRLVGAIFLVILAIFLSWRSFNRAPQTFKPELVEITSQQSSQLQNVQEASTALVVASSLEASSSSDVAQLPPSKPNPKEQIKKSSQADSAANKTFIKKPQHKIIASLQKPKKQSQALLPSDKNATQKPVKKIMIQLAALSSQQAADSLKKRLAAIGIHAYFSQIKTDKGEVIRVRVGPFSSRAEADAMLKRLSQYGLSGNLLP